MGKHLEFKFGVGILIYVLLINLINTKIAFSEAFILLGLVLILASFIRYKNEVFYKKLIKILRPFLIIGLVFFIFLEGIIIGFPKNNKEDSDYLIVLGAGIHGEELSNTLRGRVKKAIKYINSHDDDMMIVLSGGQGENEDISEALAMKRYLVQNNISEDRIILEDKSTNTKENLLFSKEIIESLENKEIKDLDITIVTTDFHAFRSNMLAKSFGYNGVKLTTSLTNPLLIPIQYSREAFAIIKSYIFDVS